MKNTNVGHVLDFCFKQFIAKFDIGGQLVRDIDEIDGDKDLGVSKVLGARR